MTRPLRFVMDRVETDGTRHELRIEQLSEGYKIVIAMVADLAARMAEANPAMPNPLEATGIVLIDEVDLHLHPRWQRTILKELTGVFRNVQFVVSTHSPIIVVGAAGVAQVVNLNNTLSDENTLSEISVSNVGQVLLSDLFGLKSLQSPEWDDKIRERDELYNLELDTIKALEQVLALPNQTQQTIDKLNHAIELSKQSLNNMTSPSRPFSGMLISQLHE